MLRNGPWQGRLSAAVLFIVSVVVGQDRAGAPAYFDGEYWEYNVKLVSDTRQGTSSDRLEEAIYRVEIKDGKIEVDEVFSRGNASIHDPLSKHKWFDFPLSVGKKWKYRYHRQRGRKGKARWRFPGLVVAGLETITTPAGTFSAFKITREETQGSYAYWYSPATKSVVKFEHKRYSGGDELRIHLITELIKYKVQKK